MASLHYCSRRLILFNASRLINRNAILLQSSRKKHHLVFHRPLFQKGFVFKKSDLLFSIDRQTFKRFASSNVNPLKETDSDTPKPENVSTSQSAQLNKEDLSAQNSSVVIDESNLPPAPLPESSVPEETVLDFVSTGLKEPSFESLGLASYWPSGLVQRGLEFLHVNLDLPWWQAIAVATLLVRILLFPVNVSVRKDTVNMVNHLPKITEIQKKVSEARLSGDFYSASTASLELQNYLKENKINMFGFLKTALIQGPVFLSMYYGLKGMAGVPVESLKTEGLFWFSDLTSPDPYYILPTILSATLLAVLELGAEGNPAKANTHTVKWVMRCFPLVIFVVSTYFSSCITYYWTVSNFIVLLQVGLLKIPAVAKFCKIPKTIRPPPTSTKAPGFIEGFKEGFENAKVIGQLQDRERLNIIQFQKAGSGAVPRTFKKNPLLQKEKK